MRNDIYYLCYIDHTGERIDVRYKFDAPLGSDARICQVDAMKRHEEALKGQNIKFGVWAADSYRKGWANTLLRN